MKWKPYFAPTLKSAKAGGAFILASEMVKVQSFTEMIRGGILSELKIRWGKKEMKIISIYRPSPDQKV